MTFIEPRSKLFGHLDRLAEIKADGGTSMPVNVEIDLSNRCSLGCEWCHFGYTHTRGPLAGKRDKPAAAVPGGDLMDTDLARNIVKQLADAGVTSITWTGGGEPTLHPDFDEIVWRTAALGLHQALYTHGGHIDDNRADLLKRHMTFVYVSLDAADRNAYQARKGVDRFQNACDGISRLAAAAAGDATVGVGMLVGADTPLEEIPEVVELGQRLGADYVQFRPIIDYDIADPGRAPASAEWVDAALAAIAKAAYYQPTVEWDAERFRALQMWRGHGYETCWWSMLQTCITPNGKVWTCVNKREHPAAELGDLTAEPFTDIWARHTAATVDGDCRLMCRGHIANLALTEILADRPHAAFV